jgi:hypothetical protein
MNSTEDKRSSSPASKQPYEAPRILSREPLEAIAATCSGPGKANPGLCPTGPINS